MRELYYIGLIFMLFLAWGCEQEDDLTPSGHEKEWMIIEEPDSDDPVDKLRYEIFRDYGVPTYYNDTIGSEERVDMLGNTYTYYERLKIFYYPGGSTSTNYKEALLGLVKEEKRAATLLPVLEEFRDQVFSRFAKGTRFPAFLFVDSIWFYNISMDSYRVESYYGYNTMAVNMDSLAILGVEKFTRKTLVDYFAGMLASSTHSTWRGAFFHVTQKLKPGTTNIYSSETKYGTSVADVLSGTTYTVKEELGFITSFISTYYGTESTPTEAIDLSSYIDAVLTRSEVDFAGNYGQYEPVMEKFRLMREKLEQLGYQFTN